MSTWNYRVMTCLVGDEVEYFIAEAYYDENGKVDGWTAAAIAAAGSSLDELRADLQRMLEACDQPVLGGVGTAAVT